MHLSLYKKPSLSTIIDQQKRYSIQQMNRLQQSNHKLDQLQQRMKSLLLKDPTRRHHLITEDFPSDQLNRYSQSLKKQKMNISDNKQVEYHQNSDDMLLENHGGDDGNEDKIIDRRESCVSQKRKRGGDGERWMMKQGVNNRRKSNTSLRIFKKTKTKPIQIDTNVDAQAKINQRRPFLISGSKQSHQLQSVFQPNGQLILPIQTNQDVLQINRLEQMMQKSIQIKEKQLIFGQQEVRKLQKMKIQQYRKNMELEIELQKIKQISSQAIFNPIKIKSSSTQQITPQTLKIIVQQISSTCQELTSQNQKLLKQLKKLQQQEYSLKLQKKRVSFQFQQMQKEYTKLIKARTNRMKENIDQNYQKLQEDNEEDSYKLLGKKNQSVKTLKTNKKHSLSSFQAKGQTERERTGYKNANPNNNMISKSKEKFTTPIHEKSQLKPQRVTKSTSCSVINRNRHTLADCQHLNKVCETDKILFSMVHQLDKLKQIVNKQIVKTRTKKGQRRLFQIYDSKEVKRENIGKMR